MGLTSASGQTESSQECGSNADLQLAGIAPADSAGDSHQSETMETLANEIPNGWSLWQETRSAYLKVVISVLLTLVLTWAFAGWQTIDIAGWICLTGIILTCIQAYPILISRDGPDLATPIGTIRSFYGSLEHHGPLFRRMWLLITPEGRSCRAFSDYDSFRLYWKRRLREWRHRSGAWAMTPIVAEVTEIRSHSLNSNADCISIEFQVVIKIRGRRHLGPVAEYQVEANAYKAKDGFWYLDQGALPE
jgi:hypothetical protein